MVALIEMADEQPFNRGAEGKRKRNTEREREKNVAGEARQCQREIRAEHVERAVREVDDPHNAEDEREPARGKEDQQAVLQAVQNLDENEIHDDLSPDTRMAGIGIPAIPISLARE